MLGIDIDVYEGDQDVLNGSEMDDDVRKGMNGCTSVLDQYQVVIGRSTLKHMNDGEDAASEPARLKRVGSTR